MEHLQVEMMVALMVVLKVALTAYYWADRKATMKVFHLVEMMARY